MSSYSVPTPPQNRSPRAFMSVAAVVALAVMAVGAPAFMRIDVEIDGTTRAIAAGSTVAEMVEAGWVEAGPGDLLDIDGFVLLEGGGRPADIRVNGRAATLGTPLSRGDALDARPGGDLVESTVTTVAAIPPDVRRTGSGPLVALGSPGSTGLAERVLGEFSGKVVSERVLRIAEPMVLKRYTPTSAVKRVALTFDDGPWPTQTSRLLDILAAENVKATFFVIGRQVYRNEAVVRRVVAEGHLLGNHTQGHLNLASAGTPTVAEQITEGQEAVKKVAGVTPTWFRPPGGRLSSAVWNECTRENLSIAMWTVDPSDWGPDPAVSRLVQDVLANVRPGGVILMHDGGGDRSATLEALPSIIHELKKRGYTFVTMDELKG